MSDATPFEIDYALAMALIASLQELEASDKIVICESDNQQLVAKLLTNVRAMAPSSDLTSDELALIKRFCQVCLANERLYESDYDHIGGNARVIRDIMDKLPDGVTGWSNRF